MSKHYHPEKAPGQTWQFTTPTGRCDGFLTRFDALKAAATNERQDRQEAENGTGLIAKVLKKYFTANPA